MKPCTRILLLLLIFSACTYSAKALTASFVADVTSGCAPLVVHFTNTSSGATSYYWDLGNGTTTTLTDASTSYTAPGTYTATLTATSGGVSVTYKMVITVFPPPTVSFTASDTSVCPDAPVTFTSTTIAGVPGAVTLTWDFGDGTVLTGSSPITHAYAAPGFYDVKLFATNSKGCTASLTVVRYMHIFTPAAIAMKATPTYICKAPGSVLFTNLTTGISPFSFAWQFGDGGTSALTNPSHIYSIPGTYSISLTVTDGNGSIDSATWPSYIFVSGLKASFTAPATGCINSTITFKNTSTTHIASNWTFGDGGVSSTNDGSHAYTASGTYTVTLVAFDGSCFDTVSQVITILPGPVASFTQSPMPPCPPPIPITFTATVPSGATVKWIYGDGGTGTGIVATHTYLKRGIYTISMVVTDPATGCTDTTNCIDTLYDMFPAIKATPDSGCIPLPVTLACSILTHEPDTTMPPIPYPFGVASYTWDFGDGSGPGYGSPVTHTYVTSGTFYAVVTVLTTNGCLIMDTVKVLTGTPPVVTGTVTPTHICYNKSSSFVLTVVSGVADKFYWDFNDGTVATDSLPFTSHQFALPGVFVVTVTPLYHGCPGPPIVFPAVTVDSPKAVIKANFNCSLRTEVDFYDVSLGDDSHLWIFGDGTTSTLKNPVHTYPSPAVYTAVLTTYNIRSGCRDTTSLTFDLTKPVLDFIPDHYAVCKNGIIHFTPVVTGGAAVAYYWYVNDTTFLYDTSHVGLFTHVLTDTFYKTGIDKITLVIVDGFGCYDTVNKNITVAWPVVNFTATPPSGCWPLTVTFTDKSTDVPGVSFTNYDWDFGDGGIASVFVPTVSHTYITGGSFSVKEVVTDNIGCSDSLTLPLITVYRPAAVFSASNTYPCPGDNIFFTNGSTGIVSSFWTFGDGTTDTTTSPWHTYSSVGTYTVSLVVTDAHGCTDTAEYVNYITVTKPKAAFTMSDSFAICAPLKVLFTNKSVTAVGYNWSFGDGNTSILVNPSDLYVKPGIDTVRLIATNTYGCSDTAYARVTLFGYAGDFTYTPIKGCAPLTVNFAANLINVPNIIWDFSDGTTSKVSYTDSMIHTYVLPGEYLPKLILSDNSGCENSSLGIDTIKVDAVRPGFTTMPNPVCQGIPINFVDTSGSYFSSVSKWLWTLTNGDTSTLSSPTYIYDSTGTFPVTLFVTDGWGCSGSATQQVTIFPPPVITTSPDTLICLTDAATLTGYGGVSYTWSPAGSVSCTACNPTYASPEVPTTYTVTGTDVNGCRNTDTVSVFLKTQTISASHGDASVCEGGSVPLFDSGGTKYTWIPETGISDPTSPTPLARPDFTTKYAAVAQLAGCLPDTTYVTVTVYPIPTVTAGADQWLVEGSTAHLQAVGTNVHSYYWTDASTLSCDSCLNPVASMSVTTTYMVHVASEFGCRDSATVTIHLFCDKGQIFVPNSFTPNGDGQNDVFYPRGKGVSIIKSFRIYNRWGQLLFERSDIQMNDATNAWDGSYQGGPPRPDVYVYVVDAVCETGAPINIKGDVTIIR